MRKLYTSAMIVLGITLLTFGGRAFAQENTTIQILIGEQKSVDVSDVKRVAIADPEIADVKILRDTNEMLITGIAAGATTLSIWDNGGNKQSMTIKVLARDPKVIKREVEELLKDVEGVEIYIVGDRVYVDGEAYREKDLARAKTISEIYPQVTVLANFDNAYLQMERLVQVDFNMYQVNKTDALSIGLKWHEFLNLSTMDTKYRWLRKTGDPTENLDVPPGAEGGDVFLFSSFNPISFNQDDGRIRFLENHQVVVTSGEEADYFVGGQWPYQTVQALGGAAIITFEWKDFGSKFKVTPIIDKINNLNVQLDADMTRIDFSISTDDIPGLSTVKTRTNVNMKSDETLILGGFLTEKIEKQSQGMPGLSKIPVLGYLFGAKDFADTKSEGVVFMTPSIVTPMDGPKEYPRIKGVLDKYEVDDFKL